MERMSFPDARPEIAMSAGVQFIGDLAGARIECQISAEALAEHFGACARKDRDVISVFLANLQRIHAVAEVKLPQRLANDLPPHLTIDDF